MTLAIDLTEVTPGVLMLLLLTTLIAGAAAWFLSKSMIKAAEFPDPQPLVIALGILTLVALLGALVSGNENAYTLAATGIGAIAGAVTATWSGGRGAASREASRDDEETGGHEGPPPSS